MTLKNDTMLSGGKYRIVRFISAGGFGCTYEAVHTLMNTRVAIKEFFPKDFCNRDENTSQISVGTKSPVELVARLKKQFLREAKVLFDMKHPSVVRVIDFFEENGTAYYVMDYIDGPSLEQILKENGPMPEPQAVKYVSQICDALGYVHSQGKVHLDLKPNNVMIDSPDGRAVLIDFGTSKQYSTDGGVTSTMMGLTPGYAPPEQCSNDIKDLGAASDIYALGATLYRMLTGNTPVDSLSRSAGTQLLPLPPTVSPSVAMAIERAMTLNRNLRPQSAEEFMQIIRGAAPQTPPPAPAADSGATHIATPGAGSGGNNGGAYGGNPAPYGGGDGGYGGPQSPYGQGFGGNHYPPRKKGLSKGAVVAITIASVLFVLFAALIIWAIASPDETPVSAADTGFVVEESMECDTFIGTDTEPVEAVPEEPKTEADCISGTNGLGLTLGKHNYQGYFQHGSDQWPVSLSLTATDSYPYVTNASYRNESQGITLPLTVVNEGSHDLVLANAKGQFTLRLNRNGDGWSGQATWKDMTLPCVLN